MCICEAYPRPMTTWILPSGTPVVTPLSASPSNSSGSSMAESRYSVDEEHQGYRTTMKLRIHKVTVDDFGTFKCVTKNTVGDKEGLIRLYGECRPKLAGSIPFHVLVQSKRTSCVNQWPANRQASLRQTTAAASVRPPVARLHRIRTILRWKKCWTTRGSLRTWTSTVWTVRPVPVLPRLSEQVSTMAGTQSLLCSNLT